MPVADRGAAVLAHAEVTGLEPPQRLAVGVVVAAVVELLQEKHVRPDALDDLGHGPRLRVIARPHRRQKLAGGGL